MKQSVDILKFICTESKLKISHLDIIWEAMKRAVQKQDDVENELFRFRFRTFYFFI